MSLEEPEDFKKVCASCGHVFKSKGDWMEHTVLADHPVDTMSNETEPPYYITSPLDAIFRPLCWLLGHKAVQVKYHHPGGDVYPADYCRRCGRIRRRRP